MIKQSKFITIDTYKEVTEEPFEMLFTARWNVPQVA
jgi:hypothetical protein